MSGVNRSSAYDKCDFCSTLKYANELYDADVCAEGIHGGRTCCVAKKCMGMCSFECSNCTEIFREDEVVCVRTITFDPSFDPNVDTVAGIHTETTRIFVCLRCYNECPANSCGCRASATWNIVRDGVLHCSSCDREINKIPIKIWHGISDEEWKMRYL